MVTKSHLFPLTMPRSLIYIYKEADFVTVAILELLRDSRVEEIISPPDIVNPLTVSVQANGKKRPILVLNTLICMFTNKI